MLALGWPVGVPAAAAEPGSGEPGLLEIAAPDLAQYEEDVREQLGLARQRLDRDLEDATVPAAQLSRSFAALGQLYFLYDLPDLATACFVNARRLQPDDYRWSYYLGTLQQIDGAFDEAAASLRRAALLRPADVPTRIRLGEVEFARNRLDEAEEAFSGALRLDPASAAAIDGLGRVAASRGDLEGAIARFEKALELQPQADSIHYRLGIALRRAGDAERARHHLAQNRGGRVRFRDPLIDGLGALVRSSQVEFNAGIDAMRAGEFEEAVSYFRAALEEKPDDPLVPYNLAIALLRLGDRAAAETWLERSIEVDPDFRDGHFNLATLLAEDGRFEQAAVHFQRAHEIDPEDQAAHLAWATALSYIGRPEEAVRELESLLALDPSNSEALINLGTVLGQLGRAEEAAGAFERVLTVSADPSAEAAAHLRLAQLEEQRNRPAAALGHYQAAIELDPELDEAYTRFASALGRAGRFAEAATAFGQAIERHPENLQARFGQAMALMLAEDYRQAAQSLEAGLAAFPGEMSLAHALARLLATCPDGEIRDGERGLELAMEVFRRSPSLDHAETVAMALAELARFEEAVSWQSRVVSEAVAAGREAQAAAARRRLELYRGGRPSRAPWMSD